MSSDGNRYVLLMKCSVFNNGQFKSDNNLIEVGDTVELTSHEKELDFLERGYAEIYEELEMDTPQDQIEEQDTSQDEND